MEESLRSRGKSSDSEFCRWSKFLKIQTPNIKSVFEKNEYKPSSERPLVYHLHGHINYPRSMVLTETDYLDFIINLSKGVALGHLGQQNSAKIYMDKALKMNPNYTNSSKSTSKLFEKLSMGMGSTNSLLLP